MPDESSEKKFEEIRKFEAEEIGRARQARYRSGFRHWQTSPPQDGQPASQFVGLAFSGGGIRSATFNLGVLQGLADLGLLPIFDYLSTVSGGGYIGSWLSAWIRRERLSDVQDGLKTDRPNRDANPQPRQIRFLREYSNYLTPKLGLASGDTWAFVGAYLRNLLLNQIILGLVLFALLLVSRPIVLYFWHIAGGKPGWKSPLAGSLFLALAVGTTIANLSAQARRDKFASSDDEMLLATPFDVDLLVLFPILAGVWCFWAWFWAVHRTFVNSQVAWSSWWSDLMNHQWRLAGYHVAQLTATKTLGLAVFCGLLFAAIWACGWIGGEYMRWFGKTEGGNAWDFSAHLVAAKMAAARAGFPLIRVILWAFPAGFVGGLLLAALLKVLWGFVGGRVPEWHIASWGFFLAMFVFLFVQTALYVGLVGQGFTEDAREWWGRLGGTLALGNLCLAALYAISFDGPWAVDSLPKKRIVAWVLAAIWAAITGFGVKAGKTPVSASSASKISPKLIARVAPPVFIVGLLVILSWCTNRVAPHLHDLLGARQDWFDSWLGKWQTPLSSDAYWNGMERALDGCLWVYILLLVGLALFLSWRFGINRFSMHSMYRNRLVRCYLGASRNDRQPQPFTGIDPKDDLLSFEDFLAGAQGFSETYAGPYPIYNTTLNLLNTKNLAWQQRKGASFVFTPKYSGFEFLTPDGGMISALRQTADLKKRLRLGLAMAISGAAASPNMGSHSSPALAFLMTVFNVRLGWWLGNPYDPQKRHKTWGSMGPVFGLFYLICELMGYTDHERGYVYLSDGGHFENLAVYELVRRRCRFIVVCDAGEDHALHFGDLGNAIEKCRTDFGVDIEIDVESMRAQKDSGTSKWHCAVGSIHYEKVDPEAPVGTIVYIKPTLTGDEPTDVQRYADEHPTFPHQTTADQWFTESQFESYRALGHHVAQSTFGVLGDEKELSRMDVESFFVKLRQHWYPPSRFVEASFTKHTATYTALLERMRTDEHLEFLDSQFYPEWPNLMRTALEERRAAIWLPDKPQEKRAGFYFCNELIQLMEDAYLDLNLEADFDHPDNRGWMNLFRHWSWSGMFCATWAISVGIYGARFQGFCERHLDLRPGRMELRDPVPLDAMPLGDKSAAKSYWRRIEKDDGVDFWEAELIQNFVMEGWYGPEAKLTDGQKDHKAQELSRLNLIPFDILIESPREEPEQTLRFNVGFALALVPVAPQDSIDLVYFRIQDHLRKMGLARAALNALMTQYHGRVRNRISPTPILDGASKLPGGASIWEAYPSVDAARRFRNLFESVRLRAGF